MDLNSITIRKFNKDDVNNGLLKTLSEIWYITKISDETIDKFISNSNHLYVVEFNNKIIGCATLHLQQKLIRNGTIAGFIEEVAIHSDYRGHNIGSMLIQHLINESKKFNCYKIVLTCFPERENFYLKNGFYNESINMRYNPEY